MIYTKRVMSRFRLTNRFAVDSNTESSSVLAPRRRRRRSERIFALRFITVYEWLLRRSPTPPPEITAWVRPSLWCRRQTIFNRWRRASARGLHGGGREAHCVRWNRRQKRINVENFWLAFRIPSEAIEIRWFYNDVLFFLTYNFIQKFFPAILQIGNHICTALWEFIFFSRVGKLLNTTG